jgi:competence protein CoiA
MEKPKLLQSFAVNNVGRIASIQDVANGKACNCSCPECGEVVIARQGEVREWHFAHASGADCSGSAEGALHRAAKQLIVEEGRVLLPSLAVRETVHLDDGRRGEGAVALPEETAVLTEPRLEVQFGAIRADVAAQHRDEPLLIEIAVTHFADHPKRDVVSALGIACVEIRLSPDPELLWTWDLLREQVLEDSYNREWIFHPKRALLLEEARQLAADDAKRNPLPPVPQSDAKPTRQSVTRWRLLGVPIHVTVYDWGITVWSGFDPEVNGTIKAIVRPLGGRWNPRYKVWRLPPAVFPLLVEGLEAAGVRRGP